MMNKTKMNQQLESWAKQIVAIAYDIELARQKEQWEQIRHFTNLLRHNMEQINKLTEMLEAK